MPLSAGTKFGPYEIVAPLGAGGMGEVYRALDTRIDRTVAIKILPAHLSEKADARERFEREARAISQLSHANICQLYDLGQQDGTHYIVMEFLEGDTLASRLAKGRLPLEQVLRYGAEIAEGLDQAHRTGVVHRDLKPGNIMLTRSGAKLMDFGLAKTVASVAPQSSGLSVTLTTPNASQPLTAEGTIIGTFQYMSPEQIEGKEADSRSDIFSFGAVLYEMACGRRAFDGKSQLSVASAILERDPEPISGAQPAAPPALQHLVEGALMKDPEARWQSAADIARQLRWIRSPESSASAARPSLPHRRSWERWIWAAATLALLALLLWFAVFNRPQRRVVRAYITPPSDAAFDFMGDFSAPPVASPDGTRVAFAARGPKEGNSIWVRRLDTANAEKLAGTENAYAIFWSADGKFLGFFADEKLKKISASGGPVTFLADAPNARGGAWNQDNVILYTPDYRDALWKVNANGGTAVQVTKIDPSKHSTHRWPSFLPDGKHFLFYATNHAGGRPADNGIYMGALDSSESKMILATDSAGLYASGYLLFHQQTALVAQKFDASGGILSSDPVTLVNDVQHDGGTFHTVFSVAGDNVLLYQPGANTVGDTDLLWMDRSGKVLGRVAERGSYKGGRLSRDGKRLAVSLGDPSTNIWILDVERGTRTRLTFDGASHRMASWSGDGQSVVFNSQVGATVMSGSTLHTKPANGGGQDQLLLARKDSQGAPASLFWPQWSPDGRYLVYLEQSGPTGASIWAMPTFGDTKPFPVVKPESPTGKVVHVRLSPDGHWLAYSAIDGNREEVYVTSFPEGNGRWQISREGGTFPVWRGDGKEIYYLAMTDANLYAARLNAEGSRFEVGESQPLFPLRSVFSMGEPYDVMPDGKRFVVFNQPEGSSSPMMLVLNWTAELNK
jgi:Tol biopolymer transport system component/tRNA A-37 threonylcarbamoyl transferase component Bud32